MEAQYVVVSVLPSYAHFAMTRRVEHQTRAVRLKPTYTQLQAHRECKQVTLVQHAKFVRRSETAGD